MRGHTVFALGSVIMIGAPILARTFEYRTVDPKAALLSVLFGLIFLSCAVSRLEATVKHVREESE